MLVRVAAAAADCPCSCVDNGNKSQGCQEQFQRLPMCYPGGCVTTTLPTHRQPVRGRQTASAQQHMHETATVKQHLRRTRVLLQPAKTMLLPTQQQQAPNPTAQHQVKADQLPATQPLAQHNSSRRSTTATASGAVSSHIKRMGQHVHQAYCVAPGQQPCRICTADMEPWTCSV